MRFPFAAIIIFCFVEVAGAQELPPANQARVVLSEQRTQIWRTFNLNPDCTAADVIVAKVTKQGKGQLEFEESLGFSTYPKEFSKIWVQHSTDRWTFSILYVTCGVQGD